MLLGNGTLLYRNLDGIIRFVYFTDFVGDARVTAETSRARRPLRPRRRRAHLQDGRRHRSGRRADGQPLWLLRIPPLPARSRRQRRNGRVLRALPVEKERR